MIKQEPKEEQETVGMPPTKKRKMLENDTVSLVQENKDEKTEEGINSNTKINVEKEKAKSEEDVFGELVAMGLKKLKDPLKSICKMQIQGCLFNAQYPDMQQPIMATPQQPQVPQVPSSLFDKSH